MLLYEHTLIDLVDMVMEAMENVVVVVVAKKKKGFSKGGGRQKQSRTTCEYMNISWINECHPCEAPESNDP